MQFTITVKKINQPGGMRLSLMGLVHLKRVLTVRKKMMQKLISIDTQLCKTSPEWVLRFEKTSITFKGENAQEKLESFLRHLGNKSCNRNMTFAISNPADW